MKTVVLRKKLSLTITTRYRAWHKGTGLLMYYYTSFLKSV